MNVCNNCKVHHYGASYYNWCYDCYEKLGDKVYTLKCKCNEITNVHIDDVKRTSKYYERDIAGTIIGMDIVYFYGVCKYCGGENEIVLKSDNEKRYITNKL